MSTNSEENFLAPFDAFLTGLDKHDEEEKLFMLAGIMEMLRHTKSATDVYYMTELFVALMQNYVDWPRIPFSITKTLLSRGFHDDVKRLGVPDALVATVIRTGLLLFIDEMQADPTTAPTYEALWLNVKAAAESVVPPPEEPPPNPKLPVVSPEVFNPRLVRRAFEPAKLTPELAGKLKLHVVTYRGMMPNEKLGPTNRGIAIQADEHFHVLLETGELLQVPKDDQNLVISTAPEDFKNINPAVLLMLVAGCDAFAAYAILDAEQAEQIKTGSLGKRRKPHFAGYAPAEEILPLEHVFDIGREAVRMGVTGATGPVGASVRFPVPSWDDVSVVVVIEASQDSFGPYSTTRLVQPGQNNKDVVLMRHEVPRHYSLRGVYLFPLQDRLVSLTII